MKKAPVLLIRHVSCLISNKQYQNLYLCYCGNRFITRSWQIKSKKCKSCGCHQKQIAGSMKKTHGLSESSTYSSWSNMKARCTNKNNPYFNNYGGRGIKVCERWMTFSNFLKDMGKRPKNTTLDRINNDGNYEPGNCRWATRIQQEYNKRNTVKLRYDGKMLSIREIANITGIKPGTLRTRLYRGWDLDKALKEGLNAKKRK